MPNTLRHATRAGFTIVELLVVIAIIGLMALFALPKLGPAYDHTMVRSARTAVTNLYNATRTAARASNRVAVLRLSGNALVIERNFPFPSTAKDTATMGGKFHDLYQQYGVTVTGPDSVRVDPRGMLMPSGTHTWVVTRDGWSDSVMVNSYGRMIR
jgi:prepilin-type N-terminal cleavage/methylation domain-containing protein